MKAKILFLYLLLGISSIVAADYKIVDAGNGEPVSGAVVSLRDSISNKIIEADISGKDGAFHISSQLKAEHVLRIESAGHEILEVKSPDVKSGATISLQPASTDLNEVVVYAEQDHLSQKGGKFIFTPGSLRTEVSNIYQLIVHTPLIRPSGGGFTILGNPHPAKLKINGLEPREWGAGFMQALQSLPATAILAVEVSPNAGSSENAGFSGGVINLIVDIPDEGVLQRLNASLSHTTEFSTSESYWIGWRTKQLKGSANVAFGNYASSNTVISDYTFHNLDRKISQTSHRSSNSQDLSAGVCLGYNHTFTGSIGGGISLNSGHSWEMERSSSTVTEGGFTTFTEFNSQNRMPWYAPTFSVSAWYTEKPRPRTNMVDILAGYSRNVKGSYNLYDYISSEPQLSERQDLDLNSQYYSLRANYQHWFAGRYHLSAGYDVYAGDIHQVQQYQDKPKDDFHYKEMGNSLFGEWTAAWTPAFNTKIGIRMEHAYTRARQADGAISFSRSRADFFPNIVLSYNIPKGQQGMSLEVSRKVYRPNYAELNPYKNWDSEYSYMTGNPDLRPSYAWNFDLNYSFLNSWVVVLRWSHHPGMRGNYTYADDGYTVSSLANLSKSETGSINIEYYKSFLEHFRINTSLTLYHTSLRGMIQDAELQSTSTYVRLNLNLLYVISKRYNWRTNIGFNYRSPERGLTNDGKHRYNLSARVSKEWRSGLQMSLGVDRIIKDRSWTSFTSDAYDYEIRILHAPLNIGLSLSYVFGNLRVTGAKQRNVKIR